MGLDLTLYKKKDFEDLESGSASWTEDLELAYGRKTWAIEEWFASRSKVVEDDWLFDVPEEVWNEFYVKAFTLKDTIETLLKAYELDDPTVSPVAYNKLDDILTDLLDSNSFQLGADWEARALLRWIEANDKVKEAYKEGSVYMEASY